MSELKKATREGFGEAIVELGKANENIYVVDIDIGKSCKTGAFRKELPEQYLNVKIACSHGGVTPANDGASHQCIEDMGILRTLPNMTVIMPADYYAAKALVKAAADYYGPVYLRFTRDAVPVICDEDTKFEIGKANLLRDGSDVADVVAESGKGVLRRIGIQDQYGQSAPYERLLAMNGITVENIVKTAESL